MRIEVSRDIATRSWHLSLLFKGLNNALDKLVAAMQIILACDIDLGM